MYQQTPLGPAARVTIETLICARILLGGFSIADENCTSNSSQTQLQNYKSQMCCQT